MAHGGLVGILDICRNENLSSMVRQPLKSQTGTSPGRHLPTQPVRTAQHTGVMKMKIKTNLRAGKSINNTVVSISSTSSRCVGL
jgi:hypothetical protein